MEERIRKAIQAALAEAGATDAAFVVERPAEMTHGDYATNVGLVAAKTLGMQPREVAMRVQSALQFTLGEAASKVEIAGPGFVNITLAPDAIRAITSEAAEREEWGKGNAESGKRVMIEYSNPNAFKEMHAGHLVGSVVGESLARLIENEGAAVCRDTFGGDIGPNVAKAIWALQQKGITEPESAQQIGEAYTFGAQAYEGDPAAKAEIDTLNQAIYAGTDSALMDLWHRGREISMEEFRRIWKLLGTKFDYEFFDSETTETGVRVVHDGLAKGIFEKSDGAIIYNGENKGVHTMVFITSHDTPTYEAKDIGLAFLKEQRWDSTDIIILTGNEQTGRFKTVLAALDELAPLVAKKMRHIATGFLTLTTGKMSSREGNVITAAGLIKEITLKASEKNADPLIAEQVAIGAIKYMILRQSPGSNIIFDPEKSLSLEGDSGPYLQYALVRAAKILSYSSEEAGGAEIPAEPYAIERLIIHYPEVAARAAKELAPNLLVNYLTELAGAWNSFYASQQVLGSPEEQYKQRVARAFAQTMVNGLGLLGIPAPERM
jgi:arginyl-tRNA synthetase